MRGDHDRRGALRALRSSGNALEVINELLEDMSPEFQLKMFQLARFHYERNLEIYGTWQHKVKTRFLSDEFIEDEINKRTAVQRWSITEPLPQYDSMPQQRRKQDLIIEEAKYRGISNKYAKYWVGMERGNHHYRAQNLKVEHFRCNERSGHSFITQDEHYICVNCRGKVSHEEVARWIDSNVRHWLRKPTG